MPLKNGIERWRGEVTEKLNHISDTLEGVNRQFEDVYNRVNTLEKEQSKTVGKLGVYGVLIGTVTAAIVDFIMHRLLG